MYLNFKYNGYATMVDPVIIICRYDSGFEVDFHNIILVHIEGNSPSILAFFFFNDAVI